MTPLVHTLFRQSRTLRDVIVMSCMLDLAREDVSTAMDLVGARIEGLLRLTMTRIAAMLFGAGPADGAASLGRRTTRRLRRPFTGPKRNLSKWQRWSVKLRAVLLLVGWFALPMTAVVGVCVAIATLELQLAER